MMVCGLLGCFGKAFKRSPSATSLGGGEQPIQTHYYGERHNHGDRNNGRNGRPISHHGMGVSSPHPGTSSPAPGASSSSEADMRTALAGPLTATTGPAAQPAAVTAAAAAATTPEGGSQSGSPSASAAATSLAAAAAAASRSGTTLVKLDRDGPSRRTPLHIAAERGQLHVLSAIIESLCCAATATLLVEDAGGIGRGSENSQGSQVGGAARSTADGGSWDVIGEPYLGPESRGRTMEAVEAGTTGRHPGHQQQQHAHRQQQQQGSAPRRASTGQRHQRGEGCVAVGEFPVGRPGAGGAPLAPEQYIQLHLNMQDAEGTTALSLACRFGHVDCCRLLLANGSSRTLSDARGNTPLHYAALRGHLGVVFMLLDEFVEPGQEDELNGYVDARNQSGCTSLHYAVWGRQSGSVQVLLQHGANVLPRTCRPAQELTPPVMVVGSTPLHLAAARGHVEICRIILKTFAERVLEPLQLSEDDPQPTTLASLDPRVQVNANGHMPYQVAQRLGFYPLAMLLRPSIPILRLFSDEERAVRFYGPVPLRAIAAEALNKKLLSELDALAAAAAAAPPPPPAATRQQLPPPAAVSAAAAAAGSGGGGGDAAAGAQRPVSAPATLEQLEAAAATEAEEEVRLGGGGRSGSTGGRQNASGGGPTSSVSEAPPSRASPVRPTEMPNGFAASPPSGRGRGGASPRQLNLDTAVAGDTAVGDETRPSSSARRLLVSESRPSPSGTQPPPPRTPSVIPPVETQLLSPSGVSPRLVSPIAMIPISPSAGGGGSVSPSASLHPSPPQVQPPSRGPSGRRIAPSPTSNRSSNAIMSAAAPLVAALSRPPSAPRANGQTAESPRGQVLLSLPGQPDGPELQALRIEPARDSGGEPESSTASTMTMAATTPAMAAAVAGTPGGGPVIGDGSAEGSAAAMYGPRTPSRQPSAGVLYVRRLPRSPSGSAYTAAASPSLGSGSSGNGGGSGCGSSSTIGISATRPPTFSHAMSGSLGAAFALDGGVGGGGVVSGRQRNSNDDGGGGSGGPAGLVRLRSNPLFEDVHAAYDSAAAVPLVSAGAATAAAGSMPPLAEEDVSEDEQGSVTTSRSRLPYTPVRRPRIGSRPSRTSGDRGVGGGDGGDDDAVGAMVGAPVVSADVSYGRPTTSTNTNTAAVAADAAALVAVDDDDLECGVCMESLPMVGISPCRHQICGPCARRICCLNIQRPSHCPFCRATISAFAAPALLTPSVT